MNNVVKILWSVLFYISMFITGLFIGYNYPNDSYDKGYQDDYNKYIETYIPYSSGKSIPVKRPNPKLLRKGPLK